MHISPNRHPLLSWSSHPERPQQEVVALAMTHPAQIRVQARCRHVADWLRRGCREAGGRGANHQGSGGGRTGLWILESGFARDGGEAAAPTELFANVITSLDAKLVTGCSHVSPDPSWSLAPRPVRASTGWTCGRARPAIGRIRTHPILKVVDPATSSAPRNVCLAGKSTPPVRLGPPSSGTPSLQAKLGWSMSKVTMLLVTALSPKRAGGAVSRTRPP